MPRPKSKDGLLELSAINFKKLLDYIDALPPEKQGATFPQQFMNRNTRDVLAHLHHWHQMLQEWYQMGMAGNKPEMPAKGYTWKTTSELNHEIQKMYANEALKEVQLNLDSSQKKLMNMIQNHSNEELFEKKRYAWTGSTSLGAYFISATSSHYDWALKLIKRALK